MPTSTRNKAHDNRPGFGDLMRFFARLLAGRKLWILLLMLLAGLLSGHLAMPRAIAAHDAAKQEEIQDIASIAATLLDAQQVSAAQDAELGDPELDAENAANLDYWSGIFRKTQAISQDYKVMARYDNQERPQQLDRAWHELYQTLLEGYEAGLVPHDSDIIRRVGEVPLLEEQIYNRAREEVGLEVKELRPTYSRAQYREEVLSGFHLLSLMPLLVVILLLQTSFSGDYECGSYKLIESLPVKRLRRQAARLLSQGLLVVCGVLLCLVLVGFTYPAEPEAFLLAGHGDLLHLDRFLAHEGGFAAYLQPLRTYAVRAGVLYVLLLLFFALLTMLISERTKSSILALFLPLSLLIVTALPNYMQTRLGRLPSGFTALFSPQLILENKAALGYPAMVALLSVVSLAMVAVILFAGARKE